MLLDTEICGFKIIFWVNSTTMNIHVKLMNIHLLVIYSAEMHIYPERMKLLFFSLK